MYCFVYITCVFYFLYIIVCILLWVHCFVYISLPHSFKDARNSDFEDSIKARVRKAFDTSPLDDLKEDEINEEKLSAEVSIMLQILMF